MKIYANIFIFAVNYALYHKRIVLSRLRKQQGGHDESEMEEQQNRRNCKKTDG